VTSRTADLPVHALRESHHLAATKHFLARLAKRLTGINFGLVDSLPTLLSDSNLIGE
jgi:hypothetical protein